ncbi:hypothetical protein Hypma_000602 [Hypsizygus marmoreus]|uniref:Uncharacterized protein n=1 Tax=Hypsizygus marmoreus TaxID=39966 RepID=A0A369JEX1_HYPMA|nr:hypothetical protein Hypma_000602 [Hypsizygus marmoreus]
MSDTEMTTSATQEAGPSGRKRKRPADQSGSKSQKKSRKAFSRQPKKPKRPSDWHLKKGEVPKDAERTKAALELHLRVLWRLPDQNAIPPKVTSNDKAPFTRRFASEAQVKSSVTASLDQNSGHIHNAQAAVRDFMQSLPEGSTISNNIK